MTRERLGNIALAVGSFLAITLAAELALRFVLLRNLNPFQPDETIGYRLKESFDGLYPRTRVRTDEHGRRVPTDFDGIAGGRYLFVGDSVAFGFGIAAEQSFAYLVGKRLGSGDDAGNAAVPGYNLEQVVAALRENVKIKTPEFAVYGLVVNDVYGAGRMLRYEDIDPHAARSQSGGFLSRSMLIAWIERRWRRIETRFGDVEQRPGSARSDVLDFERELAPEIVSAFDRQWDELEQIAERASFPIYVVICPFRRQVEEAKDLDALQRFVLARCESSSLNCLDPLALMQQHDDEELFSGNSTFHYSPHGHSVLADWLAERLRP